MTSREAATFACLADTVLAPAPPLPPVRDTDAVPAFETWLARSPRPHRVAVRAVLLVLAASRWRRRAPADRLAVLRRVERAGGRPVVEALRAVAAMSYYGDAGVAARVGYRPPT